METLEEKFEGAKGPAVPIRPASGGSSVVVEGYRACSGCGQRFAAAPAGFGMDFCPACLGQGLQVKWRCPRCGRHLVGGKWDRGKACPEAIGCLPPPPPPAPPPPDPVTNVEFLRRWRETDSSLAEAEAAFAQARTRHEEVKAAVTGLQAQLDGIRRGTSEPATFQSVRAALAQLDARKLDLAALEIVHDHHGHHRVRERERAKSEREGLRKKFSVGWARSDDELSRLAAEREQSQ